MDGLGRTKRDLTFPRWDKVFDSLKPVLLHPSSPLGIQTVIERGGAQLSAGLEVPAGNLQITHEGCNGQRFVIRLSSDFYLGFYSRLRIRILTTPEPPMKFPQNSSDFSIF